jgi:hypothetical protein
MYPLGFTSIAMENLNFICIKWNKAYTSPWAGFKLTNLVVIGIDCIGSCTSNYHTITTTTAPWTIWNSSQQITNFDIEIYFLSWAPPTLQVGGYLRFPPPIKLTALIWQKYCWKWR